MKIKSLLISIPFFICALIHAQAPQAISYQAVIRDINGNPMLNRPVQMRFTVSGNGGADIFYQESHSVSSDALGGIHLAIGEGNPITGSFANIDWKSGDVSIGVEMDPTGGQNFSPFGNSPMLSVPYSLYAHQAGSLDDDASIDPGQLGSGGAVVGQVLIWNGSEWAPGDDTDEQTLTVNGNQLSISNGNVVTLPTGTGGDNWGSQVIETDPTLSGDGTLSSPLELARQSAATGEVLKWDGSSWSPASDDGQVYTAGDGININGNTISNTGDDDDDPDNELQTLSLNGQTLSITNGGSVNLPSTVYTAGTGINIAANTISALNTQSMWNANQLQNRGVSSTAPSNGQVLKWDGSNWAPGADNGQAYVEGTGINITGNSIAAENTQELWNASQLRSFNITDVAPTEGQVLKYVATAGGWTPQPSSPSYWTASGNEIYYSNNVGIGTSNPESRLHVMGGSLQIEDQSISKILTATLAFTSHVSPMTDNLRSLGSLTRRWTDVFAVDGTINTSDAREKTNIQNLEYGLDEIMKLRPVSFSWIARPLTGTKLGLIAQEVEVIMPEVVVNPIRTPSLDPEDGEGSDRLGMYYSDLIPVLIKAIQEQEEKIKQLQAEIEILKQN